MKRLKSFKGTVTLAALLLLSLNNHIFSSASDLPLLEQVKPSAATNKSLTVHVVPHSYNQ
jgi:hypothetical protein